MNIQIDLKHLENGLTLYSFVIEGGVVKPQVLVRISGYEGDVIYSGRGPAWLYGKLVIDSRGDVAVYHPKYGAIYIWPVDKTGKVFDVDTGVEREVGGEGTAYIRYWSIDRFEVVDVRIYGGEYPPSKLGETIKHLKPFRDRNILIYGPMPIFLSSMLVKYYSELGNKVAVYDPRLGAVYINWMPGYVKPLEIGGRPRILGVLGHPNSGKSVFMNILSDMLRTRGYRVLMQEGDLTAPTQKWSLYNQDIRRKLKRYMDRELRLKWILDSLSNLKRGGDVDIVIVDLGGGETVDGRHIYITEENKAIIEYIDDIVIVSRDDEGQINRVLQEVREKTHVNIVGIYESVYEVGGKRYSIYEPVYHLDRDAYKRGDLPRETLNVIRRFIDRYLDIIGLRRSITPGLSR